MSRTDLPPHAYRHLEDVAREPDAGSPLPSRYRRIREIGRGGMGVIHEAEDTELGRRVAIKVLREGGDVSEAVRRRFLREARAMAGVVHPNIVKVYDAGEVEGDPYLVMEFVSGRTLSGVFADRSVDRSPLIRLLEQAARGIAAAHEKGIVHRDVKPGNILVTDSETAKVTDFGLARWAEDGSSLTRTGQIIGTPMYMAPEQVSGANDAVGTATDVYALGAILYEILTGRPPHTGSSAIEICARIAREEPIRPRRLNADVPRDLETICLRAVEKHPHRRYADAEAFAGDLRRFMDGKRISARAPGPVRRAVRWARRHPFWTALPPAAMIAVIVMLAIQFTQRRNQLAGFLAEGRSAMKDYREHRADARGLDVLQAYTSALTVDPHDPEARGELAAYYFFEFEIAEAAEDRRARERYRRLVLIYDDGTLAPRLRARGELLLNSEPSGATVLASRYEDKEGRLVPAAEESLGVTPVRAALEPGSWLLVIRRTGFPDARYPVVIRREGRHEGTIRLRTATDIGKGYVFVPGGDFIRGGDDEAMERPPRETVHVPDFLISRFEVTCAQYLKFLNDRKFHTVQEAWKHVPRKSGRRQPYWTRVGDRIVMTGSQPKWPAFGMSWDGAVEYCRWKTFRAGQAGVRATYRLPTTLEWEKAARGVDGRRFPWGDRFDWTFTSGGRSQESGLTPTVVGAFAVDESPYGVRDLAGSIREWCSDWYDEPSGLKQARGGAWGIPVPAYFHAASRMGFYSTQVGLVGGFRIVREPR